MESIDTMIFIEQGPTILPSPIPHLLSPITLNGIKSYIMKFNPIELLHECIRFSPIPLSAREIATCLNTIIGYTGNYGISGINRNNFVIYGSTDQKRRAAEIFGIGLSIGFVHSILNFSFNRIVQIPPRGQLKRADYYCEKNNEILIYETKGTTNPNKVFENLEAGQNKKDSHVDTDIPIKNINGEQYQIGKIAFSSFIPTEEYPFPCQMYVADPPIGNSKGIKVIKELGIEKIQFLDILDYCGYSKYISKFLRRWQGISYSYRSNDFIREFKNDLNASFNYSLGDIIYRGRYIKLPQSNNQLSLFIGCNEEKLLSIGDFQFELTAERRIPNQEIVEKSIIDDDTILILFGRKTSK